MCGIAGGSWHRTDEKINYRLDKALHAMRHRGPDDSGFELNSSIYGTVALGHTRLSIIDLSPAGHQPMLSLDGRYALIFNGEIYNYRELRTELQTKGCTFVTNSDTEVLLQAWIVWGSSCLHRLLGMFAFVVHDRHQQTLTCVRDAFGIKPFFYSCDSDSFEFASEKEALLTLRGKGQALDWQRSYDYLINGDYDSQEHSFTVGVKHLLPAHLMVFDIAKAKLSKAITWWQPSINQKEPIDFDESVAIVRAQFLDNIRLHLRSDVPLGVALSGGIDSSAVACAMRHLEPDMPIHTFSFIAENCDLSEEVWVDSVNSYIKATPHKIVATSKELLSDLDDMIRAQGEPFGSTSIYAQYRVFKMASDAGITVTLDGQGADELLAGYKGYPGQRLLSLIETGHVFEALSFAYNWSRWPGREYKKAWMLLGKLLLPNRLYVYARKVLGRDSSPAWLNHDILTDAGVRLGEPIEKLSSSARGRRVIERLCSSLQRRGLPALLRHADRNAMFFSVESRVPFLTIPMAERLLAMPEDFLISNKGETKSVFRAAMRGIVPDNILDRKDKIGFATPEKDWLIRMAPELREWLQGSSDIPFINRDELLKKFDSIDSGKTNFDWKVVWRLVNFIRWHDITFN